MRAKIVENPSEAGNKWDILTRRWYQWGWVYRDSCYGDKAKERALNLAKKYQNPETIEIISPSRD